MPQENTGKLRSKLFTLLVLIVAFVAFGGGEPIREAEASLSEINACSGTFHSGLDGCAGDYQSCVAANCPNGSGCQQCWPNHVTCFNNESYTYSDCLSNITFTQDTCTDAIIAAQVCEATRDACVEEYALDTSQEFTCLGKAFECRNASGIDRCQ